MNFQEAFSLLKSALKAYPGQEVRLALLLMENISGKSLPYFDPKLANEPIDAKDVNNYVKRLDASEPYQLILGEASFAGLTLKLSEDALIPRHETEILFEIAKEQISQMSKQDLSLVDLCTGTGCLALAVKRAFPSLRIGAYDICDKALALANENAKFNNLEVQFHKCDLLSEDLKESFDCLLSNPPYIPQKDLELLEKSVRLYEPSLALDGGDDGLDFYRVLAKKHMKLLNPGGFVLLEYGQGQGNAIKEIFNKEGFVKSKLLKDYSGKERFFLLERE